jgi:hypothetical protein
MIREPALYANTRCRVDELHYKGHKACLLCMRAKMHGDLASFNTQAAEQFNSCLKKLRRGLSYMTQFTFTFTLAHYVAFYNIDKQFPHSCGRSEVSDGGEGLAGS